MWFELLNDPKCSTWQVLANCVAPDQTARVLFHHMFCKIFFLDINRAALMAMWLRLLIFSALNRSSTHCCVFELEEVEAAYWFGPLYVSIHPLRFAYGQERLEIGSWNLICGISMKNMRIHIFFIFCWTVRCRVMSLFQCFFFTLPL